MKMLAIVLSCAFASLCVAQDEANESPRTDLRGHRSDVHDLAFSPDGKRLAATGADGDIRIWDLESEKIVRELRPRVLSANDRTYGIKGERWIESIAYQPSGTYIAEIAVEPDRSRVVRLWTADAADTSKMLDVDANGARSVAFSPDGKRVAYNTRSGEKAIHHIVIRDVESGKVVADLQDNRLAATIVHFSPDGKMLATAGGTKLFVWDLESGKITHEIAGYKKAINGISFSPDGTMLAAAGDEDMVRIWRIDDGKKVRELRGRTARSSSGTPRPGAA
ncbi:MAG: PD40 domain-containing protein [Planctomycetes bacterium]|nr:PD40 domain-containing protein [Planctomycetota bacterium]